MVSGNSDTLKVRNDSNFTIPLFSNKKLKKP